MSVSSLNWLLVITVFVTPLVLAAVLIVASLRCQRKWSRWTTGSGGIMLALAFVAAVIVYGPYVWASHLESKWHPAKPKTKMELESFLSLYSQHKIQPSQSDWGRSYQLQSGEYMIQYLLLWSAPLDVVYTSDDAIMAIYTSYE